MEDSILYRSSEGRRVSRRSSTYSECRMEFSEELPEERSMQIIIFMMRVQLLAQPSSSDSEVPYALSWPRAARYMMLCAEASARLDNIIRKLSFAKAPKATCWHGEFLPQRCHLRDVVFLYLLEL